MKKLISLKIEEKILQELDKFRETVGLSRTVYFLNASRIYKLFLNNTLFDSSHDAKDEQLDRIEMLLKSLNTQEDVLRKRAAFLIRDVSVQNIPNIDTLKNDILNLLKQFEKLNTPTIAKFLNLEAGVTFKLLSTLKNEEIININNKLEWVLK